MPFYPATCGRCRSFCNTSHIVHRPAPRFLEGLSLPARFLFLPCVVARAHCRCDFSEPPRTPRRIAACPSFAPHSRMIHSCPLSQLHGTGRSTVFLRLLLHTPCRSIAFCIHRQPDVFVAPPYGIAYSSPPNKTASPLIQIVRCIVCSSS